MVMTETTVKGHTRDLSKYGKSVWVKPHKRKLPAPIGAPLKVATSAAKGFRSFGKFVYRLTHKEKMMIEEIKKEPQYYKQLDILQDDVAKLDKKVEGLVKKHDELADKWNERVASGLTKVDAEFQSLGNEMQALDKAIGILKKRIEGKIDKINSVKQRIKWIGEYKEKIPEEYIYPSGVYRVEE